ncbi:MAG TPA: LPXTG cell wall anchor domain-containing protein, partial [Bacillota bacterium]|nr:LPXTG cell wall anchor domain-containing protein [Bacillota bacterium]
GGTDDASYETTGGLTACFGGDLGGSGDYQTYAKLVFAAAGNQVVYKGAYDDGTGGDGDGSEDNKNPETGDAFVIIALLGLTALTAGAVVVKKVRR